jgi:ribosome maturation factor RimP
MSAGKTELEELIQPVVESLDCELWGLEFMTQGRRAVLRIFIEKESGVHIEDCERVSRQVSSVMDVEDTIKTEYTLEVSSPGMDRPLYTLEQFKAFVGANIKVRLRVSFEGRRKFAGQLKGVEEDEIVLGVGEEEYLLPIELIDKANVVPSF